MNKIFMCGVLVVVAAGCRNSASRSSANAADVHPASSEAHSATYTCRGDLAAPLAGEYLITMKAEAAALYWKNGPKEVNASATCKLVENPTDVVIFCNTKKEEDTAVGPFWTFQLDVASKELNVQGVMLDPTAKDQPKGLANLGKLTCSTDDAVK